VTAVRPRRSALYVPGATPRLEKAPSLGADVIIVDLEDAVAPPPRREARRAAWSPSGAAWVRRDRTPGE